MMTQLQFHTDLGSGFEFLRIDIHILRKRKREKFANHHSYPRGGVYCL